MSDGGGKPLLLSKYQKISYDMCVLRNYKGIVDVDGDDNAFNDVD